MGACSASSRVSAATSNWGPTVSNFDNHIILDHGGEQQSVYGHLLGRGITVKKGQFVRAGTRRSA